MKEIVESVFKKEFDRKYYKKFMKLTPKGKILDLGCGFGSASDIFLESGYEYIGYDIDEYYINIGKKYNPKLNISVANMINIPNQKVKAAGAVYAYSLLTLAKDEIRQSFKSCFDNLIHNGSLMIFTRFKNFNNDKPNFFVNIMPTNELTTLLSECGFTVIYSNKIDEFSICIIAKKTNKT